MPKWRQKIGAKTALIALVLISIILLGEAIFTWSKAYEELNKDFEVKAQSHIDTAAESMFLPVWDLDIDTLEGMAQALTQEPTIVSVTLTDPSGVVLAQHQEDDVFVKNPMKKTSEMISGFNGEKPIKISTLDVVYSRAQIHRELKHIAWKSVGRALIFCFIFFGVLMWTIRSLVVPIKALERTFRNFDDRKALTYIPGEHRNDELGSLARGFRTMSVQIRENISTLESRVAERTEELSKAIKHASSVNQKLSKAALHDPLTGLPNRLFINDYLEEEIAKAKFQDSLVIVAHIDLDHFKEINDSYGHTAGDFMLVEVANRMAKFTSENRVFARIGGDEFLYILTEFESIDSARDEISELRNCLLMPMNFEGITLQSSASIGVSNYPSSGNNPNDLIVNADLALYEAKEHSRGCIKLFEQPMREALNQRKTLEAEMITALDKGHFLPYFQPQVNMKTGKVCGLETLMRWNHETRGFVAPIEFLPVAKRAGLMVRIGRRVIEEAIIEAAKWKANNIEFGRLALNASAVELREGDFVEWLLQTARKHDLPPNLLSIEILETVMIKDEGLKLSETLKSLRKAGVYVELDDFGTGYASLQQVNADEIDRIKIDRGFIENMDKDKNKSAIVNAIVEMTHKMGVEVIAEGAETENELEALLKFGCHIVQGYGIAPPMPAGATEDWIELFSRNSNRKENVDNNLIEFQQPRLGAFSS